MVVSPAGVLGESLPRHLVCVNNGSASDVVSDETLLWWHLQTGVVVVATASLMSFNFFLEHCLGGSSI